MSSRQVLFSAAALMLPVVVQAATATASMDNISIRLFDLNFADAVTPAVVWQTAESVVQISGSNGDLGSFFNFSTVSTNFLETLSDTASQNSAAATASIASKSLAASGQALDARTEFESVAKTGQTSFNTGVLSPFTQLVFSATGFATANAYDFCAQNNFLSCSAAQSYVRLTTSANIFGGSTFQQAVASVEANGPNTDDFLIDSGIAQFSWVLNNTTPSPLNFQFQLTAYAYGREFSTAAIPEPSSHVLMGLGVALLLAQRVAARKRRASPTP